MSDFTKIKDFVEDVAGDACKQVLVKKAENDISSFFNKSGGDEKDKDDGGDNMALGMAKNFATNILTGDKDEKSGPEKIISGILSGDKDESAVGSVMSAVKDLF